MKRGMLSWILLGLSCAALSIVMGHAQQPPPENNGPVVKVAGRWTLYCNDPNGKTSSKYLDLEQTGNDIKGHFKGPNQSGGVQGVINNHHLVVRTKTNDVLTFRGRVDGPLVDGVIEGTTFNGTFHARGGTGTFRGVRPN